MAALSPAIFADFASSPAGSYDSAADFTDNDPRRFPEQMRAALATPPAGGMSRAAHTGAYLTRMLRGQLDFLGHQLHA